MKFFHRHHWKIVSAFCDGQVHLFDPGGTKPIIYILITNIVSRCECGDFHHQTLPGRHSLEDLRGEASEIDRVLKSLEKK